MMQTSVIHEKRAALVNIANIPSAYDNASKAQRKRERKYRLRSHAQKLIVNANIKNTKGKDIHRTARCGRRKASTGENPTIKLNEDALNSEASMGNVQTCGCGWACPVCYEQNALEQGERIWKAIQALQSQGYVPMMIALTASHTKEMPLAYSKDTFKEAWDTFNAHRRWKKFKKDFHVDHVINNVDITHGLVHGWHYHKHLLLFIDASKVDVATAFLEADAILTDLWRQALKLQGRSATKEHGVYVSDKKKSPNDYMAKIGITVQDDGTLHYEMTSSNTKDSRTIWDLLRHSMYGDKQAERLYLEYVREMTGDNWIQYGRTGLQDIIDEFEVETEADFSEKPNTDWIELSDYWWDILRWSEDGLPRIIAVAARTRSLESVRDLLFALRSELIEQNKVSDYYRLFIPEQNSIADIRVHEDWHNEKLSGDSEPTFDTG